MPNETRGPTVAVDCSCRGQNAECVLCGGTGKLARRSCIRCGGTGREGPLKCVDCRGDGWRDVDLL